MDWETWIAGQSEEVRQSFEAHVSGLKTALKTERDATKVLQDQIKGLNDKVARADGLEQQVTMLQAKLTETEGSAATATQGLTETQAKLGEVTKQFGFYKEAAAHGVANLDNAFLIAKGKGLISDEGTLDWEAFKQSAPEQFGATSPNNPARQTTLTMEDIKKMTPAQYNANRDAVNAVLAQQRA